MAEPPWREIGAFVGDWFWQRTLEGTETVLPGSRLFQVIFIRKSFQIQDRKADETPLQNALD